MMSLFQEFNDKQSEKLSEDASKVRDLLLSKLKIIEGKSLPFLSHSFSGFIKIFFSFNFTSSGHRSDFRGSKTSRKR